MKKRYIFFIGTLCDGGAERVTSILSGQMADRGMEVEILTYYDRPVFYKIHPNVKVTSVEKSTGTKNKVHNFLWIRKYFKTNAKLIISFLAPFNMMAIAAKFGTGIKIIVADRNDPTRVPTNTIIRKLRDFLYMFADGIVLQTEKNQSYFNDVIQKKSTVIYNPVNMKETAGTAPGVTKEKKIVTAGRLMPQKNQKMLIEAFAEVIKTYPEYQLVIYGEGPCRDELQSLILGMELQEKVILPGSTANLHEKIKYAQLFVLSSDYEGMPNALIEAMCLGLPVISTKVSGATDLIKDGVNGLLVDCGNTEQLAAAIKQLLGSPKEMEAYAVESAKLAERLDVSTVTEEWMAYISKICKDFD